MMENELSKKLIGWLVQTKRQGIIQSSLENHRAKNIANSIIVVQKPWLWHGSVISCNESEDTMDLTEPNCTSKKVNRRLGVRVNRRESGRGVIRSTKKNIDD